ncbi:MAG TPA: pyridoxal-dependent decarboxylase [Actinospica sp.]|nr:pyridoxal-dependent decarboxylase [Actinospica sp.]
MTHVVGFNSGNSAPAVLSLRAFRPAGDYDGLDELRTLVNQAIDVLRSVSAARKGPVAPGGPAASRAAAERALAGPLLPEEQSAEPADVFLELVRVFAEGSVDLTHPGAVARMQCPPLPVAAVAEFVTAVLNQSLHAWEAGPFALELDRWVTEELCRLAGYGPGSGGTLTAGGSVSNLMAVLAARDAAFARRSGIPTFRAGIAATGLRPVVLCSASAHFSVGKAVGLVGIGEEQIRHVPTDAVGRMIPEAADRLLSELPADEVPIMLIACAGSTDVGWVDPLPALREVTRRHGVWLHADAAYGGGALFSDRLRGMLDGIAEADSITMDLHKFGWAPASAAVFLVRHAEHLDPLSGQVTTLNADDDKAAGFIGRYGTSIQATRRVDALKIAAVLRSEGAAGIGGAVDACHALAEHAAARVRAESRLELAAEPPLSTVLLRFLPAPGIDADDFNGRLRRRLMTDGTLVTARTRVPRPDGTSRVYLKLMLLNPATSPEQVDAIIELIIATALELEKEWG